MTIISGRTFIVSPLRARRVLHQFAGFHVANHIALLLHAFEDGDGVARETIVVAPHHDGVVGIGTYDCHLGCFGERQDVLLVLQEDDALASCIKGNLMVLIVGNDFRTYLFPGHEVFAVEIAQFETCFQQTEQTLVYLLFGNLALSHRIGEASVGAAALHVGACKNSSCHGRLLGVGCAVVVLVEEVVDCPAVAGDESLEPPLLAQDVVEQTGVAATGFAIKTVIGAHHFLHITLLHQCLEGRHVGLPQVALGKHFKVEAMTVIFGTAVHRKVLSTCEQLTILSLAAIFDALVTLCSLQSTHDCKSHLGGEIRVFTIGFLSTPPTRVTEDVDVGCPEGEALILSDAPILTGYVVLGTCFIAGSRKGSFDQCVIPSGSESHSDGIDRRRAATTNAVQGFVPPVEGRDAEAVDGRRGVFHQLCLLLEREATQQVFGSCFSRKIGVFVRLSKGVENSCATTNEGKDFLCHNV